MRRPHVLAIVQAGGSGGRMDVLTRERAKPLLPVAGVFRLIDFPLSNLVNSGITDVWLSVQYHGGTLGDEISNGRPWDLDRNTGGLRLLMPEQGTGTTDEEGFAHGNADELYRIRDRLRGAAPDVVVVMSADHVYRFDVMAAVDAHQRSGAECTIVATEVSRQEAVDHAVVESDDEGRVTGFAYKPDEPSTGVVATEIFVYEPAVLVEVLEELHRELGADAGEGDTGLGDYGEHLVPRLVDRGRVIAHPMPGYWKDLGQPHKFLAAHRDLLTDDPGLLGDPDWPIVGDHQQRPAARVLAGAEVEDSLLSPGSVVSGRVVRSVIGPGTRVEAGAVVRDSVVFRDCRIERDARLDRVIVDERSVVGAGATVGAADADLDDSEAIALLGRQCRVDAGAVLPAGVRLEPGSTAD